MLQGLESQFIPLPVLPHVVLTPMLPLVILTHVLPRVILTHVLPHVVLTPVLPHLFLLIHVCYSFHSSLLCCLLLYSPSCAPHHYSSDFEVWDDLTSDSDFTLFSICISCVHDLKIPHSLPGDSGACCSSCSFSQIMKHCNWLYFTCSNNELTNDCSHFSLSLRYLRLLVKHEA